ncbi:MAG TPA: CHAT domain-containing tetratricopeptide repeat protein [Thermoanaerobaculia bacterium]|jgi:CHAT domain-containing protein/Tfp pilus assembly protein PilF|nr:CHAT domain-containing tetratricopeptide repeat protein [Thermoanaerobaculia bacterium]
MRRSQGLRRAALTALFVLAAGRGNAQTPLALSPGTTLEPSFAAGETQVFAAELAAGRLYPLTVEQQGIHLVVDVRGPEGASLAAVDSPLDRWGIETVLLRPAATGSYRIEVRAETKGVGPGRCAIRLDEIPESTPAERERIGALAAMTEAGTILRREPTGSLGKIEAALREARGHFQAAGDPPGEAEAVAALADVTHRLGRQSQAVVLYRDAVSRWRDLQRPEREMVAWNDLGLTLWERSELPAADEAFAHALDLARRLGLAYPQADVRNNQCLVLHARGGVQPALVCYREALALYHQLGETKDEATALNNLGFANFNLGEPGPAEESYRQALAIRREIGDRAGEAQALNNLAVLYRGMGEIGEALKAYGEAREILATLDDRRQEAATLNNLGVAYSAIGEVERARLYLTQALELRRKVEDRRGEIATLNSLGWLERKSGAAGKAVSLHRQALAVARATSDASNEGISRSYLGEALAAAGHPAEALAELDQALTLQRQTGDRPNEAGTLRRKGEILAAGGRTAEALPLLTQSLLASRAADDRVNETITLSARARVLRDQGELDAAAGDARAAIAALESLRARLGNPELRAAFLGSRGDVYELRVDILMRLAAAHPGQGFDRAAFEASEDARARSLLDILRESRAALRTGIDPALAARQRDLERRLALKEDRFQTLLGRAKGDPAESKALEIESEQIRAELDTLDAEIRRRNPRYADLTHPGAANTGEIQALLDSGTLLLEYFLGRERGYLWAVDANGVRAFVLPGREEIERAARAFHQTLSTPNSGGRERIGRTLSRMLLGPVAGELGERRLAIVPDGALGYIPFDVLPEPGSKDSLLARHEVVELPSASVLAAERRELARRPPARELAIVLADPVFQPDDPRIAKSARRGGGADTPLLPRLHFSRQEALGIAALAPAGAVTTRLDFAADRDLVLSGRLRDFRYIHFATHGIFNAERPELSGLALSRVDPAGKPREGFLSLRDVYDLDLAADLVVLSGCQTALGKEIRGEGLLGLTRGFLYAGAPRVIASLWWIDDRATAALMTAFYRGLWVEGLRPAAALRQARLALARQHRFRDPAYWGAFVLQGDWQ